MASFTAGDEAGTHQRARRVASRGREKPRQWTAAHSLVSRSHTRTASSAQRRCCTSYCWPPQKNTTCGRREVGGLAKRCSTARHRPRRQRVGDCTPACLETALHGLDRSSRCGHRVGSTITTDFNVCRITKKKCRPMRSGAKANNRLRAASPTWAPTGAADCRSNSKQPDPGNGWLRLIVVDERSGLVTASLIDQHSGETAHGCLGCVELAALAMVALGWGYCSFLLRQAWLVSWDAFMKLVRKKSSHTIKQSHVMDDASSSPSPRHRPQGASSSPGCLQPCRRRLHPPLPPPLLGRLRCASHLTILCPGCCTQGSRSAVRASQQPLARCSHMLSRGS